MIRHFRKKPPGPAGDPPRPGISGRLPAPDAVRGLVMVLMTVDHASFVFNAGRYATDAAAFYEAGAPIPPVPFLVRWMTHVCAPAFLFLAGAALPWSVAARRRAGWGEGRIDAHLLARGAWIAALDPLWMRWGFGGGTVFQVLYAIGGGICLMALLRRAGDRVLLAGGLALAAGCEALAGLIREAPAGRGVDIAAAFLVAGGRVEGVGYVLYPLLPWLPFLVLGWVWGRAYGRGRFENPARGLLAAALLSGLVFVVVRGLNGYGNMGLFRYGGSVFQWLHVSKYPPSLSFTAMTLALCGLLMAAALLCYPPDRRLRGDPLVVFGRSPLLFYLVHVHLMALAASWLGLRRAAGLPGALAAAALVLTVLYPVCRWYGSLREARRIERPGGR